MTQQQPLREQNKHTGLCAVPRTSSQLGDTADKPAERTEISESSKFVTDWCLFGDWGSGEVSVQCESGKNGMICRCFRQGLDLFLKGIVP